MLRNAALLAALLLSFATGGCDDAPIDDSSIGADPLPEPDPEPEPEPEPDVEPEPPIEEGADDSDAPWNQPDEPIVEPEPNEEDVTEPDPGPAPEWTEPGWIVVPIHAVKVSDDDGGRAAAITPNQVASWLDKANEVYRPARIHFEFEANEDGNDWSTLQNTAINSMSGGDPQETKDLAKALSRLWPGKIVVYFRHGPNEGATGGGFSSGKGSYVVMPGFYKTGICGVQNINLMAHEIGHYLGLPHTFTGTRTPDYETLAAAMRDNGYDNFRYEGDGILDSHPDPRYAPATCSDIEEVDVDGQIIPIPKHNVMSYYYSTDMTVSASQAAIARQVWLMRAERSITDAVANANQVVEGERIALYAQSPTSFGPQTNMDRSFHGWWSGSAQLWWSGSNDIADRLEAQFPADVGGMHRVFATFTLAPDFGVHSVLVNGKFARWVYLYAPRVQHGVPLDLGVHDLSTDPINTIKFVPVGKSSRSTGYGLGLDYLLMVPETN